MYVVRTITVVCMYDENTFTQYFAMKLYMKLSILFNQNIFNEKSTTCSLRIVSCEYIIYIPEHSSCLDIHYNRFPLKYFNHTDLNQFTRDLIQIRDH